MPTAKRFWLLAGLALLLAACNGGGAPPDLTLTGVSPDNPSVAQGRTVSLTLTFTSQQGFQGQVSLSVTDRQTGQTPSWLTLSPTSASLNVPRGGQTQASLQVGVAANAPTGSHALRLKATYGGRTVERDLTLTVNPPPNFTISLTPTNLTVQQGSSATTTLTLTPQNGFTGTVNLALVDGNGSPVSGITLSPTSLQVSGSNPVTQALTVSVGSGVTPGTYNLTLRATSGSLTKTANLNLTVTAAPPPPSPDFTVSLNPTSLTVQRGASGQTTLTLTPQNGFTGTVNLALVGENGNPVSGITLSPTSVNVTGTNPVTQDLTISVAASVAPDTYNLQVRATSGSLTKTASLSLTVQVSPAQGSGPSLAWTHVFPAYDVAYGDGIFVAVGDAVLVSSDGQSWEAVRLPQPLACPLGAITYLNGNFLAWEGYRYLDYFCSPGSSGPRLWKSSDGRTWTSHTLNFTPSNYRPHYLTRILYKDGAYYAMGFVSGYITNEGPTRAGWLYTSQDLVNWTKVGETGPLNDITSQFMPNELAQGGGYFAVVGHDLDLDEGVVLVSADGQTWAQVATGGLILTHVAFGNGQFVAVGFRPYGQGGVAFASQPGNPASPWTSLTPPDIPGRRPTALIFDGTRFLCASEGKIWSYDGTTANPNYAYLPRFVYDSWSMAFGGGRYVIMGNGFASSTDLVNWTTGFDTNIARAVAYGNGKFVLALVDYPHNVFATAPEGPFPAWKVSDPTPREYVSRLAFLDGRFVGVGDHGRIYLSVDGNSWTQVNTPTSSSLMGVAYGNGTYVAVSGDGAIVYSRASNATSWDLALQTDGEDFANVAYGNGIFVAVGSAVYTSHDGLNWTRQTSPSSNDFIHDVAFGNGYFVATDRTKIYRSRDGVSWEIVTPPPSPLIPNGEIGIERIVWGGNFFLAAGGVGDFLYVITSTDGQSWTVQDTPFFDTTSVEDVAVGEHYVLLVYRYGAVVGQLP